MANYGKRDQRAAASREEHARQSDARYTIFSNDFDPHLRTPNLTLGQAIRVLQARSDCKVFFWRSEPGLGVGFSIPADASKIAPTAGSVRLNLFSQKTDIIEAKRDLVLGCILGGMGGFRGLPNPEFKEHLAKLRELVRMDFSVPAEAWNRAAARVWPRELHDLETYGARMRTNVLRD